MNICVFGDSVAKGVVFDEIKNKYTFLKENFVNLVQSKTSVPFKNYAKFGCTVTKGSEILEKQADRLSAYQYTILEFGGNDCDLNWAEVASQPGASHMAQVPIEHFKEIYETMIEKTRGAGSHPILMSLPPLDSDRFFNWISKGLDREKILQFLENDVDYIFRWHQQYNDMIFRLADAYQIPVIDIRTDFLKQKDYKSLLCVDGMHPNKEGHKLIASSLEKYVAALCQRK